MKNNLSGNIKYPATYRAPISRRILSVLSTAILMLLALFGRAHIDAVSSKGVWIFACLCFFLAISYSLNESSSRIILYADRIEKKTWFGTKAWKRDEVVGVWLGRFGEFSLIRRHNKADNLTVPAGIKRDLLWDDWLREVDQEEIKPGYFSIFKRNAKLNAKN